MGEKTRLPDQDQRDRIVTALDETILVEAAAGTGKTTSLVGRMVALLAEGKCAIETLAAVTFTRKAAAELRSRFQAELEKAAREGRGSERAASARALAGIERCFVGTIHSFCARLLRERPVEASVDVDFREADEIEDGLVRERAWEEYVARLYAEDESPILSEMEGLGLEMSLLKGAFLALCNYPDVEEWPVPDSPPPETAPVVKKLEAYVRHMQELWPTLPLATGNDRLMPKYRAIPLMARHRDLSNPADLAGVLEEFGNQKPVLGLWPGGKDEGRAEKDAWDAFKQDFADPFLERWYGHRYGVVLRALQPALEIYDRLRGEAGVLNYQDLLIRAATLLRASPTVRRYFQRRFTHLLVDEFQDTDPIQAEVMMLLASSESDEKDWRRCRPRPGSLFVVGDPKQSIYRFRRADIVTYNQVKGIIQASRGSLVTLSSNFRSTAPIIDWVNGVFERVFPQKPTDRQPEHVPLRNARAGDPPGELVGVRVLRIPKKVGRNSRMIAEYEARWVANAIRRAVDDGVALPRTEKERAAGIAPAATWADFLIVTRMAERLSVYGMALEELGIPHEVTGGSALNESGELFLLHRCLLAAAHPEDPVALVAALRSELFGVGDDALYAFKKAGGRFRFGAAVPGALAADIAGPLEDAFERLRRYSLWLASLPPVATAERVAEDLGLFARAAASPGGDLKAGSLAKAFDLLRSSAKGLEGPVQMIDTLGGIVQPGPREREQRFDGLPARPPRTNVVRVMNLHKAKGLEAPVVFLADPSGQADHPIDLHVDRSGEKVRGYLGLRRELGQHGSRLVAHPAEWKRFEAAEAGFREAEEKRLFYVAATRAGSLLVVTQRSAYNNLNPWKFFEEHVTGAPTIPDPGRPELARTSVSIPEGEPARAVARIEERWAAARVSTYGLKTVKEIVKPITTAPPPQRHRPGSTGRSGGR